MDYGMLAAEYSRHRRVHPGVLRELLERGQVKSETRVLEVGCGTGNYLLAIAEATGCGRGASAESHQRTATGLDPSEEMLRKAVDRLRDRVGLVQGRAEQLPFPSAEFDLVYSVDVIHHVTDRAACYHEARRVLCPGGQVCTVTDSEAIIRGRQPMSVYFPESAKIDALRYPAISQLRAWMDLAGFGEIVEQTVELPYMLTDIGPYRDRAFSALHLMPEEAFRRGLERMERDLARGPIPSVSRYLLLWGRS